MTELYEPRCEKTGFLHMRKIDADQLRGEAVTAKLISAFVLLYRSSTIPLLPIYEISRL